MAGHTGPPPIPTRIKKARGTFRPDRVHNEPQPAPTTAAPPDTLTGSARELWQALAPELVRLGILTAVDREEFAVGCQLRAAGLRELDRTGPTPYALQALRDSSRIFGRYGVGASDRARIHVTPPQPESRWARLVP
jgi:hypothetical protein